MEKMGVRDLMRPGEEFPRISSHATLAEVIKALEKAQKDFSFGRKSQRILLVHEDSGKIVGKISPMDVVQGLEPCYDKIDSLKSSCRIISARTSWRR
jgi:predicted transcriptional regulator